MGEKSKVAVVTGAASPIGEAAARALAHDGAHVVLLDARNDRAAETAARLQEAGLPAEAFEADLFAEASLNALVEDLLSARGRIDILVNSTGVDATSAFLELSMQEYDRILRLNTTAPWLACRAVLPVMVHQKAGSVVNVCSVAVQPDGGLVGSTAFATSRGATVAMSKALAREFAKFDVRVNAIAPGTTMTEFMRRQVDKRDQGALDRALASTPAAAIAAPEQIASVIAFLASEAASSITGHVYNIDGGATI